MNNTPKDTTLSNRNYGIDLLRIVAMYMIVVLHILTYGGILISAKHTSPQYITANIICIAVYCGSNCFALISGYVGADTKPKYSRLIIIWLRILYYSLGITFFFYCFIPNSTSLSEWLLAIFPISTNQYWYTSAYFAMYLFTPILNTALHSLSQKESRAFIIGCIILFSIIPTLFNFDTFITEEGYSAWWLIILYYIGGYIKKYNTFNHVSTLKLILGYLCMIAITLTRELITDFALYKSPVSIEWHFIRYISPTILCSCVFLLCLFERINIHKSLQKWIILMNPLVFSVYLIHVHPLIFQYVIGNSFSQFTSYPVPIEIIAILGTALAIFLICLLIDTVREYIFRLLRIKERINSITQRKTNIDF